MKSFRNLTQAVAALSSLLACALLVMALPIRAANAGVIFDSSLGTYTTLDSELRVSDFNYAADLQFSSNTTISQVGLFTSVDQAQNIKFLIFNATTDALLLSDEKAFAQNSTQTFIYSDIINFTFLAGQTYDVGILGDGTSLTGEWGFPESYTQNGITELAHNANFQDFAAPSEAGNGSVSVFVQLLAPTTVPEPASLALFGVGLLAFGVIRRRRCA
jgi:PEP-CTERM motif